MIIIITYFASSLTNYNIIIRNGCGTANYVRRLNQQVYFSDRKKIISVIDPTFAVVKRKPEKNQACMGVLLLIWVSPNSN